MRARVCVRLVSVLFTLLTFISPFKAFPCGHDGFYVGLGYDQLLMWTTETRQGIGATSSVHFSPGFGGFASVGYDFCGSRWGIEMPFEFTRQRLNYTEWVNQFGTELEGVLHLVEWRNGLDFHFIGGAGWVYLTEGQVEDRTGGAGITASFGPGLSYFFHRSEAISTAVNLELPFRMVHYFGDHLSASGTTVLAFPIRLGIQIGF